MILYDKPGWYSLELPDGWVADEDEEPTAFYRPEGAGVIHATVQEPGPLKKGERIDPYLYLQAFLRGAGVAFDEKRARRYPHEGADVATYEFSSKGPEGRLFERLWFLTSGKFLLFLTYTCREEERDGERGEVDEIAASVRLTG